MDSSMSFIVINPLERTARLWLCEVVFCAGHCITARVRHSRDSPPVIAQILVEDFFHRIHQAFSAVSVFWFQQILCGGDRHNLAPVSVKIQRESASGFLV